MLAAQGRSVAELSSDRDAEGFDGRDVARDHQQPSQARIVPFGSAARCQQMTIAGSPRYRVTNLD